MITRNEFYNMLEAIDNAQDKMLFASVYNGIYGKEFSELSEVKIKDIDLENNFIKVGDRKVFMDKDFKKIVVDTLNQKHYTKIGKIGKSNESYELNEKSEYLMKPRPDKNNNQGLNPYKTSGLRQKYLRLKKDLGFELSPIQLLKKGAVNHLIEKKSEWTVREVQSELRSNGYTYERLKAFHDFNSYKNIKG